MQSINIKHLVVCVIASCTLSQCDNSNIVQNTPPPVDSQEVLQKTPDPGPIPGQYIIVFKDQWDRKINSEVAQQVQNFVNNKTEVYGIAEQNMKNRYENALRGFTAKLTEEQLKAIRKDPDVDYVEQDAYYKMEGGWTTPVPAKPIATFTNWWRTMRSQTTDWGVTRVGGPLNGIGKKAWVIDSGIDLDHPDLNVDIQNSASFVAGESADDLNGHGTHVAGIIAAKNNSIGTVGVAAGATVVSVKVLNQTGGGTIADQIDGVDYVAGKASTNDVVNMSTWAPAGSGTVGLEDAVYNTADSGIKFTLIAGNSALDANYYSPGKVNHNNIRTLASFGMSGGNEFWDGYSNWGAPPIDYVAPGVDILSLFNNGGTFTASGTSMAAPHMAGLMLAGCAGISTDGYVTDNRDPGYGSPQSYPIPIANMQTPNVTASVHNDHPKLDWSTCNGDVEYEIWRKVESSGSWGLWATTTALTYVDYSITDPNLQVVSAPTEPTGWVAYKIKSIHLNDTESSFSSIKYFLTDSIFPHKTSNN